MTGFFSVAGDDDKKSCVEAALISVYTTGSLHQEIGTTPPCSEPGGHLRTAVVVMGVGAETM